MTAGPLPSWRDLLLIDGVLVGAVTRPETHPAEAAREMAERVLDTTTDADLAAGAP
jgi:hypothetical protein